jgi:hypothetical protein
MMFLQFVFFSVITHTRIVQGQSTTYVKTQQKISSTSGGFAGPLADADLFGVSVAALGDLDGDGLRDMAVGAYGDDEGGTWQGAVWVLFLNADGTVKSEQKINSVHGGLTGPLGADLFGWSLAPVGDLDGNAICDLAVGAVNDSNGRGAVWLLLLEANGTVKAHLKIGNGQGGFGGTLYELDEFGSSITAIGDIDGDGVSELAVGADFDDDPYDPLDFNNEAVGSVWILFLHPDGTVRTWQKISATQGGFGGNIGLWHLFGFAVAGLGDLDGDGTADVAVGAPGKYPNGSIWILRLNPDGTVKASQKIDGVVGGLQGLLDPDDAFGVSLALLDDFDGDGQGELAVGASGDDGDLGAIWILALNPDGTVRSQRKISTTRGGFGGHLDYLDYFPSALAWLGDLDGDGFGDLAAGAKWDDDGGAERGAVWNLFLGGTPPPPRNAPAPGVQSGGSVLAPLVKDAGPRPWMWPPTVRHVLGIPPSMPPLPPLELLRRKP